MKNLTKNTVITSKRLKGHYRIKSLTSWGYVTMRGGKYQDILFSEVDKIITTK